MMLDHLCVGYVLVKELGIECLGCLEGSGRTWCTIKCKGLLG